MSAILELEQIVVEFDGFRAVDHLDLSVERGELRFLIGPNGAGKTTVVDVITGLTKPKSGSVRFGGRDITRLAEHRRVRLGIGRSFQQPTVFDSLSVIDNLDLAASFRKPIPALFARRKSVTDVVASTLERIGLAHAGSMRAAALSHGQKQWLEIGMLLVQEPQMLLLDEPVAGMSPQERLSTGALLQELAGDHTVLVIEHDMAFLRRFASSVTVLHEGRTLSEGNVEQVQNDPKVREVYLGRSRDERSGAVVGGANA
ncbi:MAG: urea ABC transporter ATP-binding protein UrtD [Acidimicrobiia bacterium]